MLQENAMYLGDFHSVQVLIESLPSFQRTNGLLGNIHVNFSYNMLHLFIP